MSTVNGFFGHIKKNHARSVFMFGGFALSIQLAFAVLLSTLNPLLQIARVFFKWLPNPEFISDLPVFFDDPASYIQIVGPYVFVLSLALFVASYYAHTTLTKMATGFRYIQPGQNVRLYNIAHYLAITAGIDVPRLGIISSYSLNSFACGRSAKTSTIVVTQGLLNELNDDELRGVIAHEIVHIMNDDIQLMAMANASQGLIKLVNWLNPMQMRSGKNAKWLLLVLPIMIPIILILAILGFVMKLSLVLASASRYFISSSREFIADAEAVRLTHNPAALISALSKIEGRSEISGLDPMTNAMMIDGEPDGEFASHPPIQERIQTLLKYSGSMVHGAAKFTDTRSFGQRRPASPEIKQAAQTTYRERTKKSLLDRIDAGSTTNIFGLPKAATGVIVVGFSLFIGFHVSANRTMSKLPGQLTEQQIKDYVKPVVEHSPIFITLDLDGDGLETISRNQGDRFFKMKQGTPAYKTGWLGSDDGFLFKDTNKNGRMDGISELITATKKKALQSKSITSIKRFDENRDGRIDASDRYFKQLMVWRDLSNDAVADEDEVFSLTDLDITSLNIRAKGFDERIVASRTKLLRKGSYDGRANRRGRVSSSQEGQFYMTSFEIDITRYKNSDGEIIAKALPEAEGSTPEKKKFVSSEIPVSMKAVAPLLRGSQSQK